MNEFENVQTFLWKHFHLEQWIVLLLQSEARLIRRGIYPSFMLCICPFNSLFCILTSQLFVFHIYASDLVFTLLISLAQLYISTNLFKCFTIALYAPKACKPDPFLSTHHDHRHQSTHFQRKQIPFELTDSLVDFLELIADLAAQFTY